MPMTSTAALPTRISQRAITHRLAITVFKHVPRLDRCVTVLGMSQPTRPGRFSRRVVLHDEPAVVADPPLAGGFGVGAFGFGLIDTAFDLGALIGLLAATRIVRRAEYAWVVAGMLGVAVGWLMIAVTPWFGLVLLGSATAAGISAVGDVAGFSLIQKRTHDAIRGRVFAAQVTAGLGANMVGFLAVGPLGEALGPQAVYGLGGALALVAVALFVIPTRGVEAIASQPRGG